MDGYNVALLYQVPTSVIHSLCGRYIMITWSQRLFYLLMFLSMYTAVGDIICNLLLSYPNHRLHHGCYPASKSLVTKSTLSFYYFFFFLLLDNNVSFVVGVCYTTKYWQLVDKISSAVIFRLFLYLISYLRIYLVYIEIIISLYRISCCFLSRLLL